MESFPKLFEPGRIGALELKNRLVMPPMQTFSFNADGTPNAKTIDYFVTRARGGVGLIICGGARPARATHVPGTPCMYEDNVIPAFKALSGAIHNAGAKAAFQINHTGKALTYTVDKKDKIKINEALGPSRVKYVKTGMVLREASIEDIERIVEQISEAARRIKESHFDMVELHAAHGYLLSSFLSPFSNRRTDKYGGSPENRARFLSEIIERIRQKVGDNFPISVRISGSDFLKGGTTLEDTLVHAPLLEEAGASVLHISGGIHENTEYQILSYLFPDAYLTHLAARVKQVVGIPVITVGKLGNPHIAEQALSDGSADFVALGRSLLADPEWPNKVYEGRLDYIRYCISCNNCWQRVLTKTREEGRLFCTVNPALGREASFKIKPSAKPKRVMVIGGEPAGMKVAEVAASRGHEVLLFEKEPVLGGQWRLGCQQPGKKTYHDVLKRLERNLTLENVRVTLNTFVTPELVSEIKPDVVVVATGATPKSLPVPGIDSPHVIQATHVINGTATVGEKVVVIGGCSMGMEVSLHLAGENKRVSLVTDKRLGQNGTKMEDNIYRTLRDRLIAKAVQIFPGCPLFEIVSEGVYLDDEGNLLFLEADTVVLAVGVEPRTEMVEALRSSVPQLHVIGDCKDPRDALEAIHDGAELGRLI